jgi:two-component system nitrogen regulation sensor histidine kinase NtrY
MRKNKIYLFLLLFSVFLLLGAVISNRWGASSMADIAQKGSQKISEKSDQCRQALNTFTAGNFSLEKPQVDRFFEKKDIGLYLFRHDSLVYWNNAQIPVERTPVVFQDQQGLVILRQGYYLYFKSESNQGTAIALCLVKPLYNLQNNYLKNDFADWTGIPKEVDIELGNLAQNPVLLGNKPVFALKGSEKLYYSARLDNLCLAIFIAGFLLLATVVLILLKNGGINNVAAAALIFTIPVLKFLMAWLKWPSFFYRSVLYDVHVFGNAQSFSDGYLGDILFNALTLLFVAGALHFYLKNTLEKTARIFNGVILFALAFCIVNRFNHAVISLVNNSTINFDFLSIFSIKYPAFIGLAALSIYSLALFVTMHKVIAFFKSKLWPHFFIFIVCNAAVCVLQQLISGSRHYFENYWLLLFSIPLFVLMKFRPSKISWNLGLQIVIMSVITSVFLNFYIEKNQGQDLKILSQLLIDRQDEILESEFAGIPGKIVKDEGLNVLFTLVSDIPNAEKEIQQTLMQKFFGSYFNRYTIDFSLFDKNCKPLLTTKKAILLNEGFFEDQIRYNSDSTAVKDLFFVKNYRENSRYIGKINLDDKRLYVMMEPKRFEELGSFPDLLLDQSQQRHEKLKTFSYAVYRLQQNTNRYGDFNYPFFSQDSAVLAMANPQFVHHYFKPDDSMEIVISQKAKNWNYFFTFNSYLLLFFSLISYCCYLIYAAVFTLQFKNSSLTRRIQTIIVALLLLAMSAVGITSGNLVSRQFEANNKKQLSEKTEIILSELAEQFDPRSFFDESEKELVNLKLKEYARLFNTDISLFSKNGYLFNTSEPKLYDLGLAASFANPNAFWNLKQNKSSSASVNEKAGTLKYLSLYTPLFDGKKELIGFMNLPYFAKQGDLANELSGIISALINVYVILFVISILGGLILSGYITQPLRLIKQQIANITLGKQNEKITWQSNDEIGKLVFEYNEMLVKLENSANLLAQSERESAWREMAKQVAHEIKNPLTPMKLNLQYLQHLMKNNPDDFKERFEKASVGIIEQIDALASIATEFSKFAKLPGKQLQTLNLAEVINTSVLIFENQKNIAITNAITEPELLVNGDKDQCLRVFNNVLKNAVQALDDTAQPHIEILCEQRGDAIIILIRDNGCGIAADLKAKIFTPNFTTKTTGSGLGLAMVKNIMQGFGGAIWFESEAAQGTTFFLEFKKAGADVLEAS